MKLCKYVKCSKPHERRSAYCSASCKTRQWELKNGKKPFIESKKASKNDIGSYIENLVKEGIKPNLRPSVEGGYYQSIPAQYETRMVPAAPTNYAMNLSLLSASTSLLESEFKLETLLKRWMGGLFVGGILDLISPSQIEQRSIVSEAKEVYIKPPNILKDRMTSAEYQDLKIERLGIKGKYKDLFGDPSKDFYMIVDGNAGHGKSWWVAEFAQYFHRNHGKVIYYAAEQSGQNLAFQEMVQSLNTSFEIETNPKRLSKAQMLNDFKKYDLVVLDSVSEMGLSPEDLKDLRSNSDCAVVGVLQSTKDGQHKGSNEWLHDVAISVNLVRFQPQLRKSRFKKIEADKSGGRVINL